MLDNLREEASSKPFFEDEAQSQQAASGVQPPARKSGKFLGMTPMQRFVIALLLMFLTCTLGMMCLLLTGKIGIYFY